MLANEASEVAWVTPAASAVQAATAAPGLKVVDDPIEQSAFTRWVSGPAGQKLGESSFQLSGLVCAACGGIIEAALYRLPGVSSAQVHISSDRATVRWDPAQTQVSALIEAVRRAGYQAVPDAAAPARAMRKAEHRQALWRLFVAGLCGMQVMMMATPSYVAGPGDLAPDLRQLLNWGGWVLSLPVMVFSAGPFFKGAWRSLRLRRIGMDVPVSLGLLITFVASTGATFDPAGIWGHEVYFDSLTMFVTFLLGSRYLEMRARHDAAQELEASLARLPEVAWRVNADGSLEALSVQRLRVGDLVRVPLGQAFPADGCIEQGQTRADESLLSGESLPVPKQPGDLGIAGSVNLGAPVLLRVQQVGADTRFEAIVSMMRSAMSQRPAAARLADRWAPPFLWAVLLLAAGGAAVWSVIDPSKALWVAVAVLIVTCPCALSLAAPATLVATARGLARRGVVLQRLDALEPLAHAQQFFFDKTGTLTADRMQMRALHLSAAGRSLWGDEQSALQAAASLAAWSTHPLSQALVQAAKERVQAAKERVQAAKDAAAEPPHPAAEAAPELPVWQQVQEHSAQGLSAIDAQGREWRLGRAAWVGGAAVAEDSGQDAQLHFGPQSAPSAPSASSGGEIWASFELEEVLRPGAAQTLHQLLAEGAAVSVLTGDTLQRAQALTTALQDANQAASQTTSAEAAQSQPTIAVLATATPDQKLQAVKAAQANGQRVVMVGDGINDAPVLAQADVSLAMGQGALVSRSQADAVISSNRLDDLLRARASARKAMRIVRQNFIWAGSYNAVCIPLALVGWLPPWAAGLGMALSSLVVIGNALRAAR